MNQAALITIANELNHDQMRVLMALLAELDYENYIQVAQIDIAEALTMQKTNVSRAVKNLIDFGIILEGPKIGRSKTYRLNPQFGWKGTVSNHKKALNAPYRPCHAIASVAVSHVQHAAVSPSPGFAA
ncbi:helix-turn-helix transcriptional regulator [Escherichia coli]|uniref:helix-turn-helix transcriptional regulator n=1 Tax=Escherichia coli TaxID=562 RepID=UPI0022E2FBE4|nr:helix-turn-helix domain-containing protein [Escherichia coli]